MQLLAATALMAAVLHAAWTLRLRRSADRFLSLWGQHFTGGVFCRVVLALAGPPPLEAVPVLEAATPCHRDTICAAGPPGACGRWPATARGFGSHWGGDGVQAAAMEDRYEPEVIDVRRDEGVSITFLDGHVARFDLLTLRQACPCAACRGLRDRGETAWPRPGSPTPLRIEHAELHGAWGLVFTWNDGHGTGIYPFESLRDWSSGHTPFGPDSGLGGTGH